MAEFSLGHHISQPTIVGVVSFGLTFEKLLLIGLIAAFIIGPNRLPAYSAKFARFLRSMRHMASGAKERMRDELGPDFDDVEWKKLDPRQYDPRRILREALSDPIEPAPKPTRAISEAASKPTKTPATQFDPDAI